MALLSHYRAAMAKTSSGELGGFDLVFKYLILFVQALIKFFRRWGRAVIQAMLAPVLTTEARSPALKCIKSAAVYHSGF